MDAAVITDPFFDAAEADEIHELSTGQRLRLPIRYFDYSTFSVKYGVPVYVAQSWLPSPALRPVEVSPGTAVVSFNAYDHRHTDLAPYRELSVMVPVVYQSTDYPDELSGYYITFLPVTTDESRIAGIEMAGYPKFIADIEIEETPTQCLCRVIVEGQDVVTVVVDPRVITPELETREGLVFNGTDAEITVSRGTLQGVTGTSANTAGAYATIGDHPLVESFRDIDLSTPAVSCSYAAHMKMILYGAHLRQPLSP